MKGFLVALNAAILVISLVGGSIYLSGSYSTYETRWREMGALNPALRSPCSTKQSGNLLKSWEVGLLWVD